jgi:hypothetical protein
MFVILAALLVAARAANSLAERKSRLASSITQERNVTLGGAFNNIGSVAQYSGLVPSQVSLWRYPQRSIPITSMLGCAILH